jgi:anaerobic ribonucleoside-triphosphate reductase
MYLDHFLKKDYGADYLQTNEHETDNHLQHVVYALNQPAAARSFQCVRADTTQLWTPDGFKYKHELKEGDRCYVWKDGKIEIEKIQKINVHDFDGELLQFKGRNYQQTVTENHRVVYARNNSCPRSSEVQISEAWQVHGLQGVWLPIPYNDGNGTNYVKATEYAKVRYTGEVWCPTTEAGVVIFREENGVPYISGNSAFWNISILQKEYFESMFEGFCFPDGSRPEWESLDKLQRHFMQWFNKEREKALLTFPVVTAATIKKDGKISDPAFEDFLCEELAAGNGFFVYMSDTADSLSSCCRLLSELADNSFSYSLGAGGVATGSKNVITLNLNRFVQDAHKQWQEDTALDATVPGFMEYLEQELQREVRILHKFQMGFEDLFQELKAQNMLPVFEADYISLEKQFLTVGINGMLESAEFLGIKAGNNPEYKEYLQRLLKVIYTTNREGAAEYGVKFNTEYVPAENLGPKNYAWDKKDGYWVPDTRECYNSYFYPVEDPSCTLGDKFILHGEEITRYLDGGSALHLNLADYPSVEGFRKLLRLMAKTGCNYLGTNVRVTSCKACGKISKRTFDTCPACGSTNVVHATRVIGYLKEVASFSSARKQEASQRIYH